MWRNVDVAFQPRLVELLGLACTTGRPLIVSNTLPAEERLRSVGVARGPAMIIDNGRRLPGDCGILSKCISIEPCRMIDF
jgi:hypothetical protein